jgi:hypothetical protein
MMQRERLLRRCYVEIRLQNIATIEIMLQGSLNRALYFIEGEGEYKPQVGWS